MIAIFKFDRNEIFKSRNFVKNTFMKGHSLSKVQGIKFLSFLKYKLFLGIIFILKIKNTLKLH